VSDDVQSVIGPYGEPQVACLDFDPQAAEVARQVAGLISRHLPPVRVEHIGSTAVPGCAGRGIVDLLLTGTDADLDAAKQLLSRLGFQQGGDALFSPHPPAYRGTWTQGDELFSLHVHVLPNGAAEIDSIRFLRSCLRSDGELARAYVAQKRAIIAGGGTDPAEYCRQKGEFLKMVLG
jgi:GrpB-like predicted nucleotidyltransferase (UPF0157 family)